MRINRAAGMTTRLTFCATLIIAVSQLSEASGNNGVSSFGGGDVPGGALSLKRNRVTANGVKNGSRRRPAIPPYPRSGPWARETGMIQAFGMPKRVFESNGDIERVSLERVSALDGKVDRVNIGGTDKAGVRAYGMPKRKPTTNGFIEREMWQPDSHVRTTRSAEFGSRNYPEDLEAQEAKVFRPLFVYRQQIADRYRVDRKKNPIYGAYQYGKYRPRNFF